MSATDLKAATVPPALTEVTRAQFLQLFVAIIYGLLPDMSIRELANASQSADGPAVLRAFHIQFMFLAIVTALAAISARRMPRIKIE